MEHTPGPWQWTLPDGLDGPYQLQGNIEYADMNPILMAFDCGCKVDKKTGRCPMGPDPEDRALIAAAPEMLEICKTALANYFFPVLFKERIITVIAKVKGDT